MQTLSTQAFQATHTFIFTHGRPLDQARFQFYFAGGSGAAVLTELARFQNPDGGFGHALEPDLRTAASSAIATAQAFAILREIAAPATEPLIRRAIDYLLATFDPVKQVWPIVPPAVEDAPHAPWWTYAENEKNFDSFTVNPKVVLLALLADYQELTPPNFLSQMTAPLIEQLVTGPDTLEMHDLHCYINLALTKNLPGRERQRLQAKLCQIAANTVERDRQKWGDYTVLPLDLAGNPDSFLSPVLDQQDVQANLDFLLDRHLPDGSWPVPWSWAFVDEAAWAQAEKDWKGFLAVNHLRVLQAYGRIDS